MDLRRHDRTRTRVKKLPLVLCALACAACTPALVAVSFAAGGATVALTVDERPLCDAGVDAH